MSLASKRRQQKKTLGNLPSVGTHVGTEKGTGPDADGEVGELEGLGDRSE